MYIGVPDNNFNMYGGCVLPNNTMTVYHTVGENKCTRSLYYLILQYHIYST